MSKPPSDFRRLRALCSNEERDADAIFAFYRRLRDGDPRNLDRPDDLVNAFLEEHPERGRYLPDLFLLLHALKRSHGAKFLGRVFQGYELKYRIGRGGMGEVYFAQALGTAVPLQMAIKVIPFDAATWPNESAEVRAERRTRAGEEARMLQCIKHEGVVTCHLAFEDPEAEAVVLLLEYIDGFSLRDLIEFSDEFSESPLPPGEAIALIVQACRVLEAVHLGDVAHRDIKPGNLLVDRAGKVVVTDFGLASFVSPLATRITHGGRIAGFTPRYAAPEQKTHRRADKRSDVYALAMTLFDLLLPSCGEVGWQIEPEDLSPDDLPDGVPVELANAILKALKQHPDDRFQSVQDFREALEGCRPASELPECLRRFDKLSLREDCPVNVWVGEDLARLRARANRSRRSALMKAFAGVGAVVLTGGAVWLATHPGKPAASPPPTPTPVPLVSSAEVKPLQIVSTNVEHFARINPKQAEPLGRIGVRSFHPRQFDQVTVHAELSRPAYAFVIACRADGEVELVFPNSEDEKPPLVDNPSYPFLPAARGERYGLKEKIGLWVFAVVVSDDPLPAYQDWPGRAALKWVPAPGQPGIVWRDDGQRIEVRNEQGGLGRCDRGKGEKGDENTLAVMRVTDSLRELVPKGTVSAIGFTVLEPK